MCTFPTILEQICRHTPNPPDQMERYRRAWAAVEAVIIVDPSIYPQQRGGRFLPYDMLYDAFPAMKCVQPRGTPRTIVLTRNYQHEADFARPFAAMMKCDVTRPGDLPPESFVERAKRPAPIYLEEGQDDYLGKCCVCNNPRCLERCSNPSCGRLVHIACAELSERNRGLVCPTYFTMW